MAELRINLVKNKQVAYSLELNVGARQGIDNKELLKTEILARRTDKTIISLDEDTISKSTSLGAIRVYENII